MREVLRKVFRSQTKRAARVLVEKRHTESLGKHLPWPRQNAHDPKGDGGDGSDIKGASGADFAGGASVKIPRRQ